MFYVFARATDNNVTVSAKKRITLFQPVAL